MELISVIDAGTGSIRNTIFDLSGKVLEVMKNDNPLIHPQPGWAEQDTAAWWTIVKDQFIDVAQPIRDQITAITVTSQRESMILRDWWPIRHGLCQKFSGYASTGRRFTRRHISFFRRKIICFHDWPGELSPSYPLPPAPACWK